MIFPLSYMILNMLAMAVGGILMGYGAIKQDGLLIGLGFALALVAILDGLRYFQMAKKLQK